MCVIKALDLKYNKGLKISSEQYITCQTPNVFDSKVSTHSLFAIFQSAWMKTFSTMFAPFLCHFPFLIRASFFYWWQMTSNFFCSCFSLLKLLTSKEFTFSTFSTFFCRSINLTFSYKIGQKVTNRKRAFIGKTYNTRVSIEIMVDMVVYIGHSYSMWGCRRWGSFLFQLQDDRS